MTAMVNEDDLFRRHRKSITRFADFLEATRGPGAVKRWTDRLRDNPEAGVAEVLVWAQLIQDARPEYEPDTAPCPVDFLCHPTSRPSYGVEVTVLGADSQGARTDLPTDGPGAFDFDTKAIFRRVVTKAGRLSSFDRPLLLIVASFHPEAHLILGQTGASELLTGVPQIRVELSDDPDGTSDVVTDLKESVFFRTEGSRVLTPESPRPTPRVVACRRHINAVLLIWFGQHEGEAVGILHPEPVRALSEELFGRIPLGRVQPWPVDDQVRVSWTADEPAVWPYER